MKKNNRFWIYSLLVTVLVFIFINSCKKEDNADNWDLGPTSTYTLSPGNSVFDSVSGYEYSVPGNSENATLDISRILSGEEAPFEGVGYKIEYSGSEAVQVTINCSLGNRVIGLMYAYPDGMYNGNLTESWQGMPAMGASSDSTRYFFALPQPYEISALKNGAKKRGANLFWFSEIAKASNDTQKMIAIELQALTFLENYYFEELNPTLKSSVITAYNSKRRTYAYGKKSFYQGFWKPLGFLAPYIYHPTVTFEFNSAKPTAEDIAHEEAHYFINLVVGNEVQKLLEDQGSIIDNHGKNDVVGRDYVVDEFVYFTETIVGYETTGLEEPVAAFSGKSPLVTDFPGIEGFGATMLYTLVRTKPTIQNIFLITQKLDFPVIGLTYEQVFDIIALGATGNNQLRTNIQNYLALYGTPAQYARFNVALQRIGWSYSVKGTLKDFVTEEPISDCTVENILKDGDGTEYNNGETPSMHITDADGNFRFFGGVFPGSSILRFSKDGMSTDVTIECPYSNPTSTIIDLPTAYLSASEYMIGQSYGGGIIFYIDGTGQHGLIAPTIDTYSVVQWGCFQTLLGGTSTAIGTGQANTTAIINACSEVGIAARICNDLVLNGYSDWFLPSKDEMDQMYLQADIIGGFAEPGGFYWTSSEINADDAYIQHFGGVGDDHDSWKGNVGMYLRAIRAF